MAKLPKIPKSPKHTASLATWEKYHHRIKEWKAKIAKIHSDAKRKQTLIAGIGKLKSK